MPVEPQEQELWALVAEAHDKSARRSNVSSSAVVTSAAGSGDYAKSIAAALMTLGGRHAPLAQTMELLNYPDPVPTASVFLDVGRKVPGWGSSFHKGVPDPAWMDVHACLIRNYPELADKLNRVTVLLQSRGRRLYPNPSAFTACLAIALGMRPDFAAFLFISMRLNAWSELFMRLTT